MRTKARGKSQKKPTTPNPVAIKDPFGKCIKRYEPVSEDFEIPYPTRVSEFDIQATIFNEMKKRGFDVKGEVHVALPNGTQCRFDIVVFRNKKAVHILEIKDACFQVEWDDHATYRQPIRYRRFGVPVTFICTMEGARLFLEYIDKRIAERKSLRRQ